MGTFTKEWGTAPDIDAPADGDTFDFPTEPVLFDWQPLAGAKSYTLEIDDDDEFILPTTFTTNNTNFTLTEPPTINQSFLWRLRATSSTGWRRQPVDDPAHIHLRLANRPALLTPPDDVGTPIRDITFSWSPVVGAKTYQIQVSPNGDWDNNVVVNVDVKSTKFNNRPSTSTTVRTSGGFGRRTRGAPPTTAAGRLEWQFTRNWPQHPNEIAPFYDGGDDTARRRPDARVDPRPARVPLRGLIGDDQSSRQAPMTSA